MNWIALIRAGSVVIAIAAVLLLAACLGPVFGVEGALLLGLVAYGIVLGVYLATEETPED